MLHLKIGSEILDMWAALGRKHDINEHCNVASA
jgi:hypothetical protein